MVCYNIYKIPKIKPSYVLMYIYNFSHSYELLRLGGYKRLTVHGSQNFLHLLLLQVLPDSDEVADMYLAAVEVGKIFCHRLVQWHYTWLYSVCP